MPNPKADGDAGWKLNVGVAAPGVVAPNEKPPTDGAGAAAGEADGVVAGGGAAVEPNEKEELPADGGVGGTLAAAKPPKGAEVAAAGLVAPVAAVGAPPELPKLKPGGDFTVAPNPNAPLLLPPNANDPPEEAAGAAAPAGVADGDAPTGALNPTCGLRLTGKFNI